MIAVGDVVRLKAEGGEDHPMLVLEIYPGCDGNTNDGVGLMCAWIDEMGHGARGVVSESSVCKPIGVKWGVAWNGLPMAPYRPVAFWARINDERTGFPAVEWRPYEVPLGQTHQEGD